MSNLNNALNGLTDELKRHRRRSSYYDMSDGSSSESQEVDTEDHDYDDSHDYDDEHGTECRDLDQDGCCDIHDHDDDFSDDDGDDDCD